MAADLCKFLIEEYETELQQLLDDTNRDGNERSISLYDDPNGRGWTVGETVVGNEMAVKNAPVPDGVIEHIHVHTHPADYPVRLSTGDFQVFTYNYIMGLPHGERIVPEKFGYAVVAARRGEQNNTPNGGVLHTLRPTSVALDLGLVEQYQLEQRVKEATDPSQAASLLEPYYESCHMALSPHDRESPVRTNRAPRASKNVTQRGRSYAPSEDELTTTSDLMRRSHSWRNYDPREFIEAGWADGKREARAELGVVEAGRLNTMLEKAHKFFTPLDPDERRDWADANPEMMRWITAWAWLEDQQHFAEFSGLHPEDFRPRD